MPKKRDFYGIDRSRKYRLKNDPIVIALRFKARRVFFSPDELQLQSFLDNWDMFLVEFFEAYGYNFLRRQNIKHFIHKLNTLVRKYRGQTLRNELIILMDSLRLDFEDIVNVFEWLSGIIEDEGFWEQCEPITQLDGFRKIVNQRERDYSNTLTLSVEVVNQNE
jgi:hypothetical protein